MKFCLIASLFDSGIRDFTWKIDCDRLVSSSVRVEATMQNFTIYFIEKVFGIFELNRASPSLEYYTPKVYGWLLYALFSVRTVQVGSLRHCTLRNIVIQTGGWSGIDPFVYLVYFITQEMRDKIAMETRRLPRVGMRS